MKLNGRPQPPSEVYPPVTKVGSVPPPRHRAMKQPASANVPPQGSYVGWVTGGGASIAIAISGRQAVAYVCDGRGVEAWLQGIAEAGQLTLIGSNGSLAGSYGDAVAAGSVIAGDEQWAFRVRTVSTPAGLYRASAAVGGSRMVGGWIVLPDGSQVGMLVIDGTVTPAPPLDLATLVTTVDGVPLRAAVVDGAGSL